MVGLYRKPASQKIDGKNDQQWQSVTVPKKCNTGQNKDPRESSNINATSAQSVFR